MKATALSTSVLAKIELTCLARNVYGPSEVSCALIQPRTSYNDGLPASAMHAQFFCCQAELPHLRMLSDAVRLINLVAIALRSIVLQDSFALADALLARSATWVLPPQLCVMLQR